MAGTQKIRLGSDKGDLRLILNALWRKSAQDWKVSRGCMRDIISGG